MATKIRLQRHGKKSYAFYHIVVADARAPRDGKFIEKLGTYNPNTNPATIELNHESAVNWLLTGAQPTDTARAILSYKGAMYKKHLQAGVNKGSITQEVADEKYAAWIAAKESKVAGKITRLASDKVTSKANQQAAEVKKNEAKAAVVAAKLAPEVEAVAEEVVAETEEATEEVTAPVAEETAAPVAEVAEAPVVVEEATPLAEVVEAPVAETPANDAPAQS